MSDPNQKSLPGHLGPVPPRQSRPGLASSRSGVARRRGGDCPWRFGPGGYRGAELNIRTVEIVAVKSSDHQNKGHIQVFKEISQSVLDLAISGAKVRIVDDPVDTGATMRVVREMLPGAHFATVYAN